MQEKGAAWVEVCQVFLMEPERDSSLCVPTGERGRPSPLPPQAFGIPLLLGELGEGRALVSRESSLLTFKVMAPGRRRTIDDCPRKGLLLLLREC